MTKRVGVKIKEKEELLREEVHMKMQQELIQIIEYANSSQLDLILRFSKKITSRR